MVNEFVCRATNGLIPEFLTPSLITPATRLLLINALFFRATWASSFDHSCTQLADFHRSDGSTTRVEMMSHGVEQMELPYYWSRTYQVAALPYAPLGETELAMVVILPKDRDGWRDVLQELDGEKFVSNLAPNRMRKENVEVYLPKFSLSSDRSGGGMMGEVLQKLGVRTAFIPGVADFGGMVERGGLHIGWVLQKAMIEVDEQGSTAAVASCVEMMCYGDMGCGGGGPFVALLRADHPFLYFVTTLDGGTILFGGVYHG
jgi:serine protease inhibitor